MQLQRTSNYIPVVTKYLLILNIGLFIIQSVLEAYNPEWGFNFFHFLALHHWKSQYFYPHQIFTHMFMHGGLSHLAFNMMTLYSLGQVIERTLGPKHFLMYYLICGLGSVALYLGVQEIELQPMISLYENYLQNPNIEDFKHFLDLYFPDARSNETVKNFVLQWDQLKTDPQGLAFITERSKEEISQVFQAHINTPMVGASGAIYGILLAFAYFLPYAPLSLFFIPIGIPAKYMVIALAGIELYLGLQNNPNDNVAHFAHLGGALIGYITLKIWKMKPLH